MRENGRKIDHRILAELRGSGFPSIQSRRCTCIFTFCLHCLVYSWLLFLFFVFLSKSSSAWCFFFLRNHITAAEQYVFSRSRLGVSGTNWSRTESAFCQAFCGRFPPIRPFIRRSCPTIIPVIVVYATVFVGSTARVLGSLPHWRQFRGRSWIVSHRNVLGKFVRQSIRFLTTWCRLKRSSCFFMFLRTRAYQGFGVTSSSQCHGIGVNAHFAWNFVLVF